MIFTQNQIQELIGLIRKSTNLFIAKNIGKKFLTKEAMKELAKLGFRESQIMSIPEMAFQFGLLSVYVKEHDAKKITFEQIKTAIQSNKFLPLSSQERFALDIIEQRAVNGITALGNKITSDVNGAILTVSEKVRKDYEEVIKSASRRAIVQRRSIKSLASEIGKRTGDWGRDLDRVADFVLHEAYDNGRAISIEKKFGKDARVYKVVQPDACPLCHEMYLENVLTGEPKIFQLSELIANGTNIGRKTKDYRSVVGPLHPFCRCWLEYIPDKYVWSNKTRSFVLPRPDRKFKGSAKVKVTISK